MFAIKKKWIFDRSLLLPGDVLFTRSEYVGTSIAKATKGRFGHVMLYLDDMVLHADLKGVYSKNTQRILMSQQSRLAAFRLKAPLFADHLKRIDSFARSRVGSLYSIPIKDTAKSLIKRPNKMADRYELGTQFCSRLVAQSFAAADIQLVVDIDFCTPNEIAASQLLQEVENAVVEANAEEIKFAKTYDYNLQIQIETYSWLNKVRALAEKHGLPPVHAQSDVGRLVVDFPMHDPEICSYIKETQYLDLYDYDERKNPWRYDPYLLLESVRSSPSPLGKLEFERRTNNSILRRVSQERRVAILNAELGYGYFLLEEQLQTNRFALMTQWRGAIDYVSNVLGVEVTAG